MKFIWLQWLDACYQSGELRADEFEQECILESVGLLSKETKTHYSISLEYDKEGNDFKYTLHIPKKYVIKKKFLKF